MTGVLSWIFTWLVMILVLVGLSKTSWGAPIVYWLIWLAVVLLVVSHSEEITASFNTQSLQLNG